MPVLMIGEVPNLTEEIYGGMIGQMMPLMRVADGFVSHAGGPHPDGGWRVVEVWESKRPPRRGSRRTSGPISRRASSQIAASTRSTRPSRSRRHQRMLTSAGSDATDRHIGVVDDRRDPGIRTESRLPIGPPLT